MPQNTQGNRRNPLTGATQSERNRASRSDSYFSDRKQSSQEDSPRETRRARRAGPAIPHLGTQLNDAMQTALQSLNKGASSPGRGQRRSFSELRRPVVPSLPHHVRAGEQDGKDHFNISLEATTDFGKAVGFYNKIPWTCTVTGQPVQSLGNYWNFLKTGMVKFRYLRAVGYANSTQSNEVRNLYAHLALAVWTKLNSNPDLKLLMSSGQMRFDFYRYSEGNAVRYGISSYVVDIYREINRAMTAGLQPDFSRWFDTENQALMRQKTGKLSDAEKLQVYTEQLRADWQHAVATDKAKREAAERKSNIESADAAIGKVAKADKRPKVNKSVSEVETSGWITDLPLTMIENKETLTGEPAQVAVDDSESMKPVSDVTPGPVSTDLAVPVSEQDPQVPPVAEPENVEEPEAPSNAVGEPSPTDESEGRVIILDGMKSQSHITF